MNRLQICLNKGRQKLPEQNFGGYMNKFAPFSLIALLLLAGCVIQSLNCFYTNEARHPMPGVAGKWSLKAQGGSEVKGKVRDWEFSEDCVLAYDDKGVRSKLETVYFKAGENIFVDCTAGSADEGTVNAYWLVNVMPVHTLCKVALDGDTLKFIPLDVKGTVKLYKEGQSGLKAVEAQGEADKVIFTSTAEEWIVFLRKNGSSAELFPEKSAYVFKKTSGSEK